MVSMCLTGPLRIRDQEDITLQGIYWRVPKTDKVSGKK